MSKELNIPVTYQDPCFLGKQNQVFDEPRKILTSIPGLEFAEMDRSKQRSLCCEGGGGRMWLKAGPKELGMERFESRKPLPWVQRYWPHLAILPFNIRRCRQNLGSADQIVVKDITELVIETII